MMYPKPKRKRKKRPPIVPPEQKARILQRAGGRCEQCHDLPDFRGLEVHEISPKQMGGTRIPYEDDELIALCGRCHSGKHGIKEV